MIACERDVRLKNNYLISVVVCTRNRVKCLEKCLASLLNQSASVASFEIIVVDNNSIDDTPALIAQIANAQNNVRYCREVQTGLSFARNRGLSESSGEYVAYIDDDAEAFPDWISQISSFIRRNRLVAAFGGPFEATMESDVPSWFPPEYGTFDLGDKEYKINCVSEFLCGTNMIFRRDMLLTIGGFHTGLGMTGDTISYGEETRLQIDLKSRGVEIYYVPAIKVKHLLSTEKMSFRWLMKSVYAVGCSSSMTFCKERTFFSSIYGVFCGGLLGLRLLLGRRGIPFRRKLYYSLIPLVSEIGAMQQVLMNKKMRMQSIRILKETDRG